MSAPGDPSVCSSVLISVLLWVELTTEAARRWSWADVGGEQDWLWTGVREDGRPCNRGRSSRPWALLKRDSDRLENGVRRPRRPVHGNCNTNDTVPSQEMFQDKKSVLLYRTGFSLCVSWALWLLWNRFLRGAKVQEDLRGSSRSNVNVHMSST